MARAPGIPVVVAVKNRSEQLEAWARKGVSGARAEARYDVGARALRSAMARFPERVHTVSATDRAPTPHPHLPLPQKMRI